jgi:hypothetical protein
MRTTPVGSIKPPTDYGPADPKGLDSPLLAHEPDALNVASLPTLPAKRK